MKLLIGVLIFFAVHVQMLSQTISVEKQGEIVNTLQEMITDKYVDEAIAPGIADSLDKISLKQMEKSQFVRTLSRALRNYSNDKHFEIFDDSKSEQANTDNINKNKNFGFQEAKILKGNIGYLKLSYFEYPEKAAKVGQAAMNFLFNSDALIIDIRDNNGGSKAMVQLILSYFFGNEPVHLFSVYGRNNEYYHGYTNVSVDGTRTPDKTVFVLINKRSFSAAEMFAFILKNRQRAVLIGKTSAGGGHTVGRYSIGDGLSVNMPIGKVVDPLTKQGWEKIGVIPDIESDNSQIIDKAYLEALKIKKSQTDAPDIFDVNWQYDILLSRMEPFKVADSLLQRYEGEYESRIVTYKSGEIFYQGRAGIDPAKLIAIDENTFRFDEVDYFRIQFVKNERGQITGLKGLWDDGFEDFSRRSK